MTDKKNGSEVTEELEGTIEEMPGMALTKPQSDVDIVLGTQKAHEALIIRAQGLEALRKASIKALKPKDFHRFGDNWWLQSSGVSKISEIYGIHYEPPIFKKEWKDRWDEETQEEVKKSHYVWHCQITATFAMDNRSYTATGSASTRDPFFMRDGAFPHPLNVDEEDVRKKAETNARARCLIGLGIANFTPDELESAGLDTSKSTGHDYKTAAPANAPSEKQWGLLFHKMNEKVVGVDKESEIHQWIKTQKLTMKHVSGIIDMLEKLTEPMDYDAFGKHVAKVAKT